MIVIMTVIGSFGCCDDSCHDGRGCYDDRCPGSYPPYHFQGDCHHNHHRHHRHHDSQHHLFLLYTSNVALGTLSNAEDAAMIVIMTIIRSFGNAKDVRMIVLIRVIFLIIFMMLVIIVITVIISFFYTFQMWR